MAVAYAVNTDSYQDVVAGVRSGERPCPEYLRYTIRYPSRILTYNDIAASDCELAQRLMAKGLLNCGFALPVFKSNRPFDCVISASEDVGFPLAVWASAEHRSTPMLMITHGFILRNPVFVKALPKLHNLSCLCLSDRLRETLVNTHGVPSERVINAGYGVDCDFFRPLNTKAGLIVSAGAANRDYRTLIRAVEALDVEVYIAADSEWHSRRPDVGYSPLPNNVTMKSCGGYGALRGLYAQALFVVVPLYQAPFACGYAVIHEAMAMAKAVIATQTEHYSDVLLDGATGYYVRPGHAGDLREKISYLLRHPEVAAEMGARGRALIEKQYSLDSYCQRLHSAVQAKCE